MKKTKKKKKQSPSLTITSLPYDVIVDILARLSIWDYSSLSLVSKHFRSLVSSSELYARRYLLGYTEACIYSILYRYDIGKYFLYLLGRRRKGNNRNSSSLVPIMPLPDIPYEPSFVSVGSKIYVLGGKPIKNSAYSIDCITQIVQLVSSIPVTMYHKIVGVIEKKIYVIGKNAKEKFTVLVFNTETQMWETQMREIEIEVSSVFRYYNFVVMADKIYVRDSNISFVYEPKEDKWEMDEKLNSCKWRGACVLDDVVYYYYYVEYKLRAYDSKDKCWKVVQGLDGVWPHGEWSLTVSYGGKLAVFFIKRESKKIWCAEIAIERRRGREIWGKVEWHDKVINGNYQLIKFLAVMV